MTTAKPALVPPTPLRPHPERRPRWFTRIAMTILGLAIGLAVAEAAFYYRDDGAFPHVNFYVADAELGVRLQPGATQRLSFGGNPVTSIRVNRDGLRGADLPPPAPDEVLVVGDSQVFGLGVEEDQTFSAVLARALGKPVVNGGVPTYGPAEYRAVIAEQLARRHPRTVVLTINLVNDLFEVNRPNKDRHAVWDGWAVRKETAPAEITQFPGRELVYRRSHLFFALRKWLHDVDSSVAEPGDTHLGEPGVASEGTWRDLVTTGEKVQQERAGIDAARQQYLATAAALHKEIASQEDEIDRRIQEVLSSREGADGFTIAVARASPGDIVRNLYAEEGRDVLATADQVSAAAAVRARLRKQLAAWAAARSRTTPGAEAMAALDARDRALARLSELDIKKLETALEPPLAAYLRDVQQLVEGAGARLVVAILPIDVQVSAEEWKKYGTSGIDMEPSKALTAELVELGHRLGLSVLDATPVLAAAEPGAFLDKDIHMTAKGHAAVGAALARTLAEPPPRPLAPSERSPVPMPELYKQAPEIIVRGSSEAACETKQIREWLRVVCSITEQARPLAVDIERDDGNETLALVMPNAVSLVIPIVAGREFAARITWTDKTRVLRVQWPGGQASAARPASPPGSTTPPSSPGPVIAFDKPVKIDGPEVNPTPPDWWKAYRSPIEAAICECWQQVFPTQGVTLHSRLRQIQTCSAAYGAPDAACIARYSQPTRRCPELLACIRRDPASPP